MKFTTPTTRGVEKTKRYGWVTKDAPGDLKMLDKDLLQIHPSYQRDMIPSKVKQITAEWSWLSCGALIVGMREGTYWVIDGQHRCLAAKRRTDITELPCVVFETVDVKQEARGFLEANTGRRPVTAIGKQKALVAADDEVAKFVQNTLDTYGVSIRSVACKAREIKCIALCMRRAKEDRDAFCSVLKMCIALSDVDNIAISERMFDGVWYINAKCGQGLADKRLVNRMQEKGGLTLITAASRASAFFVKGGGMIWAKGMVEELNKGLQKKFIIGD